MGAAVAPPRRRLRHRIPVRLRHYWKLLAGCVAFLAVVAVVFSTVRVQPYVTSSSDGEGDVVTQNIAGTRDLFDATVAHEITVTFRDADYQRMLDTFHQEGEKDYVEADVTIDGTTISSVGVRLKGNSTLRGLTRDGESIGRSGDRPGGAADGGPPGDGAAEGRARGGRAPEGGAAEGGRAPEGGAPQGDTTEDNGGWGNRAGGGFTMTSLKAEEPETLPWLIRFDEFVEGLRYQGHREIAVRVGGMGGGSTVLNEAVTLDLLADLGEIAPRYAYSSFVVNDRPATARLVIQNPDGAFAEDIDGSGVLYKSLATGQFTDQGDDPIDYQDDFKQVTKLGSQDLQPVIDLIRWVDNSSDEEFDAGLADRIDVESFARYVALQNLLLNFDDMSGPGRNYYLWYDLSARKFTVVGWDYNLTFSGNADQGPHEQGSMRNMFRGGAAPDGGQVPGGMPDGGQVPGGMPELPEGMQPPGGGADAEDGRAPGGGFGGGHKLKERFLASDAFTEVYESAYRELYQQIYADGAASTALDELTRVLTGVDSSDGASVDTDSTRLRTLIQQRTSSLATDEVITKG
ncbi:CotH kinase family protein [Micromonospora yangpuensis]|uniref:Spore coat protein CotH n=1 Tax=Micromonospora yangpuensis TaxID=683228 RepID=A0A1C6UP27_9ACTN|nr:CotH kinase family protein [Micromonospora yangpuensis]GGM08724.1 hypothetical protein GCM10012279_28510 [Micromonospora yangpuensis]SCL55791.1 Spore coat protein CotH [Micromonospora yangpuensis]